MLGTIPREVTSDSKMIQVPPAPGKPGPGPSVWWCYGAAAVSAAENAPASNSFAPGGRWRGSEPDAGTMAAMRCARISPPALTGPASWYPHERHFPSFSREKSA